MSKEINFIPDRLNEEPVIFLGMTNSELKLLSMLAVGFWVPVCLIFTVIVGLGIVGLGLGLALAFATMWLSGKKITALKRSKPKQYHMIWLTAWLEDHAMKRKTIIRKSQVWGIHRTANNRKEKRE